MRHLHHPSLHLSLLVLVVSFHGVGAQGQGTNPSSEPPLDPPPATALTPDVGEGVAFPPVPEGCADAIVDDDGSVETGYGWVPSSTQGIYVQQYDRDEVPSGVLTTACVCWLRIRMDDTIDFEVVVFGHNDAEGFPNKEPIAAIPAQLAGLPQGVPGATFSEVPLGEVPLPSEGPFYVGVRWDPSTEDFFFACVDKTDQPGPPTRVFYRDNTFPAQWGISDKTNDPVFSDHRALFVRPVPDADVSTQLVEVPAGGIASGILMAALLLLGALALRRG